MPYQSYVQEAANNSLSRRNSRIELEDNLKTAASGRKLNDAQATSSLINAGANAQNANTNAASLGIQAQELALRGRGQAMDYDIAKQGLRQASEEMLLTDDLKRDLAGMEMEARDADRSVDIKRLGLDERRITNEERKLPFELEGLSLQNDEQKLNYISNKMKVDMQEAMQEGNIERIARVFALQDAAMSSQMQGFRSEESLHKWSFIGKWAAAIDDSLGTGNQELAQSLHKSMIQEAEEMGLDFSRMAMLQSPPNNASKDQWKMMREISLQSVDFQQKLVLANIQNKGSGLDALVKIAGLQERMAGGDRAERTSDIADTKFLRSTAGPILASALNLEINRGGFAMTDQDIAETASYNNLLATVTDMAQRLKLDGNQLTSFVSDVSSNVTMVSPEWGGDQYITQKLGVLPVAGDPTSLAFEDPSAEMKAVLDDEDFKTKIIPGYETFMEYYADDPQLVRSATSALSRLQNARDGYQRAKIHEAFIHTLTGRQNLP